MSLPGTDPEEESMAHLEASPSVAAPPGAEKDIPSHRLRKELGLRDLIPMQVLLVLGTNWPGVAAREGSTHVTFWLLGVGLFFLPVAGVVQYCTRLWPYEGGVYQWAKNALGPFYGFWSAWNFGLWALLIASSMGLITAASLSYALGPSWSWITESRTFLASLNVGLFAFLLLVNVPGLGIGRWVAHFGTAVTLLVTSLLVALIFIHPGATTWGRCSDAARSWLSRLQRSLSFPSSLPKPRACRSLPHGTICCRNGLPNCIRDIAPRYARSW
jgi:amino acid transporter